MKRLRLVFVILALSLWLPLLGFALFALRTVEADEASRYQAVGERVFDEMERELSEILTREEARPSSDYNLSHGAGPDTKEAPFVAGYFERDANGTLRHTPWAFDADLVQELVEKNAAVAVALNDLPQLAQQAAGSTLEVRPKSRPSKRYDPLSSLNRAAWSREESSRAKSASTGQSLRTPTAYAPSPPAPSASSTASAPSVGSLHVQARSERHVVLVREAVRDGQRSTQGFVVALPQLLDWLSQRVLHAAGLSRSAYLAPLGEEDSQGSSEVRLFFEHRYQHRFADPFSSQTAVLTLGSVAELEAGFSYYALSGLLLLLGALALLAGYRMAAAVVSFAERRNNFVSAVTHELKTPLTSIRMYGEMLRDDVVPDAGKRSRYYRIITAESERLTRLIDNVLELSRLERNQRPVSLSLGDVTSVVRETLEVLEPHATELGFELRFEAGADLPAVPFDRDALAQVLFNLVDNALKYGSEASERRVTVRCERQGQGVALCVADRGPGVAPEHLRQIWQPFFRSEQELTRRHKGTGIGLSLVRGLVHRMGGSVSGRNTQPGFEVTVALGTL